MQKEGCARLDGSASKPTVGLFKGSWKKTGKQARQVGKQVAVAGAGRVVPMGEEKTTLI